MNVKERFWKVNKERYLATLKWIKPNDSVLDVGCIGDEMECILFEKISKITDNLTGLDVNKKGIKMLKAKGYNVVYGNAENFSLNKKFDKIVACEIIEHLWGIESFFKSVKKHLNKNGMLIISTPNPYSLRAFLRFGLKNYSSGIDHKHLFEFENLKAYAERNGFKLVDYSFTALGYQSLLRKLFKIIFYFVPKWKENYILVLKKIN